MMLSNEVVDVAAVGMQTIHRKGRRRRVSRLPAPDVPQHHLSRSCKKTHTSKTSMALIESFFPDRVVSKGRWPPRSPDLSPPDFFLWGMLKSTVYGNKPRTLAALEGNIRRESPWLVPVHCTFQHGASHSSMSACRLRPLPALHLITSFIPWTKVSPPLITCPSVGYFARYSEKTGAYGE